jgi:hypothetical protein
MGAAISTALFFMRYLVNVFDSQAERGIVRLISRASVLFSLSKIEQAPILENPCASFFYSPQQQPAIKRRDAKSPGDHASTVINPGEGEAEIAHKKCILHHNWSSKQWSSGRCRGDGSVK